MKTTLRLAVMILLATQSFAQSIGTPPARSDEPGLDPIESLDLGACWLQKIRTSSEAEAPLMGYKGASFGVGQTFQLFKDEFSFDTLNIWIQKQLNQRFSETSALNYEVSLHCFSSGYTLSIQVDRPSQQPVCIQAKFASHQLNDLELVAMRPEQEFQSGEFCFGIEERTLGVSFKNPELVTGEILQGLISQNPEAQSMIEKIEYRPGSSFAILRLTAEYSYREVEAKGKLDAIEAIKPFVSLIWLNRMSGIAGESRFLFGGKTATKK